MIRTLKYLFLLFLSLNLHSQIFKPLLNNKPLFNFYSLQTLSSFKAKDEKTENSSISFGTILAEFGSGAVCGTIGALPGFVFIGSKPHGGSPDFAPLLLVGGFLVGSAIGTYTIGNDYNPDVSFWGTLLLGSIGTGIDIIVLLAPEHIQYNMLIPLSVIPILLEILYINLSSETKSYVVEDDSNALYIKNNDHFNASLMWKAEVIRIHF